MTKKKVEVPSSGKIKIVWNVFPYDYTDENKAAVRKLAATKYGVKESQVEVVPHVRNLNSTEENEETRKELNDLCNPENQVSLFKKYIDTYEIEGVDFETIKQINADVDSQIEYGKYERYKKYRLKWIKWDNFLSYGEDNFFNFETLEGLVLLNGYPANQTGKTTFAIDLIHFLLFGKPSEGKADVNAKIFNKFTKATQVKVEGCLNIDGTDYVIRRTLTRPAKFTEKSKISGTLEYFKVEGDNTYTALNEYDSANADASLNAESVTQTNKAIKDAIGKETDFDMIICATMKNLDELIDKGDTERGKLMTRWLGLDVIDDKFKVAKTVHEQQTVNYVSRVKNKEVLIQRTQELNAVIENNKQAIGICDTNIESLNQTIESKTAEMHAIAGQKTAIDEELLKYDSVTLNSKLNALVEEGKEVGAAIKAKDAEIQETQEKVNLQQKAIEDFGPVNFEMKQLTDATSAANSKANEINLLLSHYKDVEKRMLELKHGEFCPTCKQKLLNVDNTALIAECTAEMTAITEKGKALREEKKALDQKLEEVKAVALKSEQLNKLTNGLTSLQLQINKQQLAKSALELELSNKRTLYKETQALIDKYNSNKEAIDKNAELDRQILNMQTLLAGYNKDLLLQTSTKAGLEKEISASEKEIAQNDTDIETISKEEKMEDNWKVYLEMLGKNGVAKMEVRELTPIINIKLKEMLADVVDFDVEVNVTDKNEVVFNLVRTVKEGGKDVKVIADLTSGSGFERTCAALALRFVLGSITSIPQPNFFVIDEVIGGGVASENYDKVKKLFDKEIANNKNGIDFVLHCTHIDDIKDWHKSIITIQKHGYVSSVSVSAN